MIVVAIGFMIGFLFTLRAGIDRQIRNECEYWSAIKTNPLFHPTNPMIEQCNNFNINLK